MDSKDSPSVSACAVVYLARGADNGAAKAVAFFDSYDRHPAGHGHDLIVITKGWEDCDGLDVVQELARSHSARVVELPDDGFDLGAYFRVTPLLTHEYLCFLNTHSVILRDNWLEILHGAVSCDGMGAVSCSGNWNTMASFRTVSFFYEFRKASFGALKRYPRYWWKTFFRYLPKMSVFPNPHIRTNAFIVRRDLWEKFTVASAFPRSKLDCLSLEHGRKGLSRFTEKSGLNLAVVGADAKIYRRDEWPQSGTFFSPGLPNLLIGDNQSQIYLSMSPYFQWLSENANWGRSPRKYPGYGKYSLKDSLFNWSIRFSKTISPRFKKMNKRLNAVIELAKRLSGAYGAVLDGSPLFFTESAEFFHNNPIGSYAPPDGVLFDSSARPLSIVIAPRMASRKGKVVVLIPSSRIENTSGGPNTAYALVAELIRLGIPTRILSVTLPPNQDDGAIRNHIAKIGKLDATQAARLEFVDASDRQTPVMLGSGDVFLATAWWTAQMVKTALPRFDAKQFVYLIQDFEPLLYEASSSYIMANETYSFDFLPIFNTRLLRDYFIENRVGKFSNSTFANNSLCFEPAFNRSDYHPENSMSGDQKRKHRLLFYARPHAKRNLIDFGVAALMKMIAQGECNPENWEFFATDTGVGGKCREIVLRNHPEVRLSLLPVHSVDAWVKEMRRTDVMLSLIMSPHPSYPPYEAAASGALVVTNTWSVKTEERLREIFPNVIPAPPTIDGIAAALSSAARMVERGCGHARLGEVNCPHSWEESFQGVMPELLKFLAERGIVRE